MIDFLESAVVSFILVASKILPMFSKEVYIQRRQELRKKFVSGIILLPGNTNSPRNYRANIYPFRQDSNFLYYFGLDYPGFAGIIDVDEGIDLLFADDFTMEDIIWMGPQAKVKALAESCGIEHTAPFSKLADFIAKGIEQVRKIHFTPPYRAENKLLIEHLTGIHPENIADAASQKLIKSIVAQRSIKSQDEIEHIEEIMDVAYEMHTMAMRMTVEKMYEYEIAGAVTGIALQHGGSLSFPAILSKRGEILHNEYHLNRLEKGDLLVCDMGFESEWHYATDHTRTYPVSGKFTSRQKEIYDIVLAANNAVFREAKPGIPYRDMHMLAARTIAYGLKDLGLMKGNVEEAVREGAHALFFPHGLGHMMGLDVHDMEDLGENYVGYGEDFTRSEQFGTAYLRLARTLEPGFVLTNEPGIYFIPALISQWKKENKFEQFIDYKKLEKYLDFGGIRLEDDMLITKTGNKNLGKKRIPIEVSELEEIVGSYWKK